MSFGASVAKAKSRGHDIRRRLFLRRTATDEQARLRLYSGNSPLGEVRRGWNLGADEKVEFQTGERYYPLFIDLVDDPNGELLQALKSATKVKINSVDFKFLSKPSFLGAVPSYTFKVQPMGES